MPVPPGKQPTQQEIATDLGISVAAVSLALSGKPGVSDQVRATVLEKATALGYRRNASAVALRTRRSNVLGLLIRNLRNPFFLDLIDGFDEACAKAGYEVMVGSSRYDQEREQKLLDTFADRGLDGLAVAPIGRGRAVGAWAAATERPVVVLNAPRRRAGRLAMSVSPDGPAAVQLAVEHLRGLGHQRIAMVAAPAEKSPDPERLELFLDLAAEERFTASVIEAELDLNTTREAVCRALGDAPGRRPTAFITNSDYLAHAVYLAAADHGLRIPEDVSVVGHDDLPTSAILNPPLTTLRVDRHRLGAEAAGLLIDAVEGREPPSLELTIPVSLEVRGSTASA
ncbi:LacI family transcriptional regulator [Pseudonocardiaceae bacterium YIM PH 21723]|nr:LacI family transcriptional regulator [Pseudonocardiaceae bacterium YIM PH 21723]